MYSTDGSADYSTAKPISPNRVQAILRNKDADKTVGSLRLAVPECQSSLFQNLAKEIAFGRTAMSNLLFTTGFGLARGADVPVRLPALIVPVLSILEKQNELGLPVSRYRIYQATDFIAQTNGIDAQQAHEVSERMRIYLQRYIETVHADVVDAVDLLFGCDYPASITRYVKDIRDQIANVVDNESLKLSELKHSNTNGQALRYAAANVLYNGATAEYPFEDASHILPVGGKSEHIFFSITQKVAEENSRSVIPLLTGIGICPTYYAYSQHRDPVSIHHPIPNYSPIRRDFVALESDGASLDVLRKIYPMQL